MREKSEKNVRKTALQAPRSVKEGEEVLQAPEQQFLCSPWWRLCWSSCAPSAHGGPQGSRDLPAHGETQAREDSSEGSSNSCRAHGGAASWQQPWLMRDPCWTCLFLKDIALLETTHTGTALEELQPVGGTTCWSRERVCNPPGWGKWKSHGSLCPVLANQLFHHHHFICWGEVADFFLQMQHPLVQRFWREDTLKPYYTQCK